MEDAEQVRRVLERAVQRIAPSWLANDLDDLVQSALIRVMRADDREESARRPASYLWKAAHSAVMDEIRRRRRRREASLSDEGATGPSGERSPPPQETDELWAIISAGLARLSPERRQAVLLYLYGYSLQESATILDWTTKQVDNRRYRGLAELRRYLTRNGYPS